MTIKSFDTIIIGMDLGGLLAAAILVKRGKSVVVVDLAGGQAIFDSNLPSLAPSPNLIAGLGTDGVLSDILSELNISLIRRRSFTVADPAFQVVMPQHRIDVPASRSELKKRLEAEFPNDSSILQDWLVYSDSTFLKLNKLIREPGLLRAPGIMGKERISKPIKDFTRGLTEEDATYYNTRLAGLTPSARAFCAGCTAMLTRQQGETVPAILAGYHLGLTKSGLHRAEDGNKSLVGFLKEKIVTLRGGFCQAEKIESFKLKKNPSINLRFKGLEGDYLSPHLIWNTNPELLEELLAKRLWRSLKIDQDYRISSSPVLMQMVVRIKSEGLPVGLLDDCVLVPEPIKPIEGLNLLVLTIPPGGREQKVCDLLVSFQIDNPASWNQAAAAAAAGHIQQALLEPIPFLNDFLVEIQKAQAVEALGRDPYALTIKPARLPIGLGAFSVRSLNLAVLYAGRDAFPGLGMIGEAVVGKACADLITRQY